MKKPLAFAAMFLLATPALAAPDEPVKAIMDLAGQLWSDKPPEGKDYFDKDHISLFSKDFVTAYREAEKYPIYDEGGGPFGYDVITNSQDGCPLKDVAIVPAPEAAGVSDVKVTFKLMSCYADDPGKDAISEVHFDVVTEDGRPVISDIHRVIDGKPDSLVKEMKDIAKTGAETPAEQTEQPPQ
jgi:hypothetical protein